MILRDLWRASEGTYGVDLTRWPGGLSEFTTFCSTLQAAGLGVGLHLYGPSISLDDPLVTPVPQDGLLGWPLPGLTSAVGSTDDTLLLAGIADVPQASGGGFPGNVVRLGDELIRYTSLEIGSPSRLLGCTRGALGSVATAHAAGAVPRHLATLNDLLLVDPEGPLLDQIALNLGALVNAADIDFVYFDGAARIPTDRFVKRWYYLNKTMRRMVEAFDHPVLVQTGLGAGRDLDWHFVPRSASADGHGDIKFYLNDRTPVIESIRASLTTPDIGWYGFDAGRPPDHLEYICARALAWDCGISLQTHVSELNRDARARETMEMIARYERWKRAGGPPQATQSLLLQPGVDFRLLEDAGGAPHLFEADYDAGIDVRTLPGGSRSWTVGNTSGQDRVLEVEITRGLAIRAHADFSAAGITTVDALVDPAPYVQGGSNDSARLLQRVERVESTVGAARQGVTHTLTAVPDAAVGGQALELSAVNTRSSIGWCGVGRQLSPALDLGSQSATGLWVFGDGSGAELSIELYDESDDRLVVKVPLFFQGWRFHTFDLSPSAAFDASRVTYLVFVLADLPPTSTTTMRLAFLRATPGVVAPADLTGVTLDVGGRLITLPAPIPPGGTVRIDGLGRLTQWAGGMTPGTTTALVGGPLVISPGVSTLVLSASGPSPYPGDVVVRTSRLTQRYPE